MLRTDDGSSGIGSWVLECRKELEWLRGCRKLDYAAVKMTVLVHARYVLRNTT